MHHPLQLIVSCSNSLNSDAGVAVPVDDDGGPPLVVFCNMNCSCEGLGILQMATFITPIKWETHHALNSCQAGSKVHLTGLTKHKFKVNLAKETFRPYHS